MAMEFFKKDKNKNQNQSVQPEVAPVKKTEATAEKASEKKVFTMKSTEEIDKIIAKTFDVFENTPYKMLWNIFYSQNKDAVFDPMEYVYKSLRETNLRFNEINEAGSDEYTDTDPVQKDMLGFIKQLQERSVMLIKSLLIESVEAGMDSFLQGIDTAEFEKALAEYSDYKKFEEFRYACENKRNEERTKPLDCQVIAKMSSDKIHGWVAVFPPINGGAEIQEDSLKKALASARIISCIDDKLIAAIIGKKKYMQIFEIARGEEVVNGKDGYIIDKFSRKNEINIREDEHGNINYKELNNIKSVHKGDVITEVYYPVEGKNGKSVDGRIINAKKGVQPKIPRGKNTSLTEDGSLLCADKDGELVFKDGVFFINELLTIQNDVDNASGNINFSGDILIKGDVREGFSVKAEGNITIEGTCEGAFIEAGGDITIQRGMTGGGKGTIKTDSNLKCVFLENCSVNAKGRVEVDQVMYSEISTSDAIIVSGKKGSVTGGKLIAGKSITAEIIGAANNPYLKTDIVLGATPELIKKHATVGYNLKEVSDKLFKVNQDINYIEENINRMPPERVAKLDQLKIQQKFVKMQKGNLEESLAKLSAELEETKKSCSLECKVLNPTINFHVGESTYTLNRALKDCKLGFSDDKVVISSPSLSEHIYF